MGVKINQWKIAFQVKFSILKSHYRYKQSMLIFTSVWYTFNYAAFVGSMWDIMYYTLFWMSMNILTFTHSFSMTGFLYKEKDWLRKLCDMTEQMKRVERHRKSKLFLVFPFC